MQLDVPVLLHEFDEGAAVRPIGPADLLGPVHADDLETGRDTMTERAADALGRAESDRLARIDGVRELGHARPALPLYRRRTGDDWLRTRVDVVWEVGGSPPRRVWAPAFDFRRWTDANTEGLARLDDHPDVEDLPEVLADFVELVRRRDDTTASHPVEPRTSEATQLPVSFEPERHATEAADGVPLDTLAASSGGAIGRSDILREMVDLLGADPPRSVVLVGPSRAGKTTMVRRLAQRAGDDPDLGDFDATVWQVDPSRFGAGEPASRRRFRTRLAETLERRGGIAYVGRLRRIAREDALLDTSLTAHLASLLERRGVPLVAEATVAEWTEFQQNHTRLAAELVAVRVPEPSEMTGREITDRTIRFEAERRGVEVTTDALDQAWRLHNRFPGPGATFGRTIDFLRRLLRRADVTYRDDLSVDDVVASFCRETGLPVGLVGEERTLSVDDLRERLRERVVGQPRAVEAAARVVTLMKADLGAADRPLGVLLFAGPTGVGKTEMARALAASLFGSEDHLVRLDMGEYTEPGSHHRLVGGDARREGDLTAPVRRQPFSVVLLDEIEKAESGVHDLLLQVLGEGRLTARRGRTTSFQNAIVVLTTNLGGEPPDDADDTDPEQRLRRRVDEHFRSEFVGRIDEFVPFESLGRDAAVEIARRELERLDDRHGLRRRALQLHTGSDVPAWLVDREWEAAYGARPVERAVEQRVAWPLAGALAERDLDDIGHDIRITPNDDDLEFAFPGADAEGERDRLAQLGASVERVTTLRRRLDRCVASPQFEGWRRRVRQFDRSAGDTDFWEGEASAEAASRAEEARSRVADAEELAEDVRALEDLAREAYHERNLELRGEVAHQIDDVAPKVEQLFRDLLAEAYSSPDRVALVFPADHPEDEWRDELVGWLQQFADRGGWTSTLWQGIPGAERSADIDVGDAYRRTDLWRRQRSPQGKVVALEWEGRGVRAFAAVEAGRHRILAEDEETVERDVFVPSADSGWPHPDEVVERDRTEHQAHTWNLREGELVIPGETTVEWSPDDPWRRGFEVVERLAWKRAIRRASERDDGGNG